MPYQTFDFVQKDFIEYKEVSALLIDVVHKKNNLDDLNSRQKNTTVEMYRPTLRYTNLQTEQRQQNRRYGLQARIQINLPKRQTRDHR